MSRTKLLLAALAALLAASAVALAATKPPPPATPTIESGPANPTQQTSASFTFSDATAGATMLCSLDGATYAACTSPAFYSGLAQGTHNFRVEAVAATRTSAAATFKWTIDTTPPVVKLLFPKSKGLYDAASWNAGCAAGAGECGSASDPSGVASVTVSVLQQGTGKYWNGSAFSSSTEVFNTAGGTTQWRSALPLPPDGEYTVHVRSTDAVGNTTAAASQLSASFQIDTQGPPAPQITLAPPAETESTSATFRFKDAQAGVKFFCHLDSAGYAQCKTPTSYSGLSAGTHVFYLKAEDKAGNASTVTSYTWTVGSAGKPFTIAGNVSEPLAPGISRTLALTVTNPNTVAITVTSLTVTPGAGSSKEGCDGPTNLAVTQSNASSTNPLVVPASGHVSLPAGSVSTPQVLMRDLATNQDACKGASFAFTYGGSAHS
jgi:large repetitive protein